MIGKARRTDFESGDFFHEAKLHRGFQEVLFDQHGGNLSSSHPLVDQDRLGRFVRPEYANDQLVK